MHCPTCGSFLREILYEGVTIHTCDNCGGELMGPHAIAHVVNVRDAHFDDDIIEHLRTRKPMYGVPADQPVRRINCPGCRTTMNVMNYGGDTGVMIDRCPRCFTMWLDRAELEKIQILTENWEDAAAAQIGSITAALEATRREVAERTNKVFAGSRFAFANALINRVLDAV